MNKKAKIDWGTVFIITVTIIFCSTIMITLALSHYEKKELCESNNLKLTSDELYCISSGDKVNVYLIVSKGVFNQEYKLGRMVAIKDE